MGEDIIDMDLNMEGGRKEEREKEQDGAIENQEVHQEVGGQHPEEDEDEPRLVLEHSGEENGRIRSIQHLDGMQYLM